MSRVATTLPMALALWLALGASPDAQEPVGGFVANLPTPTSPAFAVLDVSPTKIVHPATPNELGASIVNGVDGLGAIQTGVAVDFAPYMTWAGRRLTRDAYRTQAVQRFLSRLQTSFATVKAADAGGNAVRAAVGISATLFDVGDPRASQWLASCLAAANRAALATKPPVGPPPDDLDADALEKFKEGIERIEANRERTFANTCREDARPKLWNRSAMTIGIAPTWISATGDIQHLAGNGTAMWASAAYGFEGVPWWQSSSQLVGFVEHRTDRAAPTTSIGTRWRVGTGETSLSLEVLHLARMSAESDGWSVGVSGQKKLAGNWWITLAVGGESHSTNGGTQTFVLNTLSWSYAER
jgi:hypothetical protein